MRRIAVINISFPPDKRNVWEDLVKQYARKTRWHEPINREKGKTSIYCEVDTQDPGYEAFKKILDERGLKYPDDVGSPGFEERFKAILESKGVTWNVIRIEHEYTDDELRSFPLLDLGVDREPIVGANCEYGTEYETTDACPHCGTGAVQVSSLMISLKGLPKKGLICHTAKGHILLGQQLADAVLAERITGVELRQAQLHGNREPLPWWQIISTYEMPKVSKASKNLGREPLHGRSCSYCQRDMHCRMNNEPMDWVFDRHAVDPEGLPDIVHTWECFGRSFLQDDPVRDEVRGFAQPAILVKPKVLDIFRKLKIKHAVFSPVRFV